MLAGKLALITGAGSGIGRAACQIMAREGARVVAADISKNSGEQTLQLLTGGPHMRAVLDVSNAAEASRIINEIKENTSRIPNILVNCAGITRDNFFLKMSTEDFQRVIDINLMGTFAMTQALCRSLVEANAGKGASIVNLASVVGQTGNIGQANYSASKASVEAFTKTVAKEMGQYDIRCNAVVPGFIESPMTDKVPHKVREMFKTRIPLGRLGKPEEVAELITFLASDKSSYINGASISITGGL